jgi:hypothetical protein
MECEDNEIYRQTDRQYFYKCVVAYQVFHTKDNYSSPSINRTSYGFTDNPDSFSPTITVVFLPVIRSLSRSPGEI